MAVAEGTWHHREAFIEAKRTREDSVSIRCSSKKLDENAPEHVIGKISIVEAKPSFDGELVENYRRGASIPLLALPLIFFPSLSSTYG